MNETTKSDAVNDYFRRFYPTAEQLAKAKIERGPMGIVYRRVLGRNTIFPAMVMRDGFEMSVQGHAGAYSSPRDDWADHYSAVEVGYPSEREDLLMQYAENPDDPRDTVYPYVPVAVVEAVIAKHGGIVP